MTFSGLMSRCTIPAAWAAERALGDLGGDVQDLVPREGPAPHALTQGLAIDELGRDEVNGIGLVDLVNGDDVGVIQRGGGFRFLHEPPHPILIRGDLEAQDLQRDFAIELRVLREIDLAHPALADLRADFIAPEFRARGQAHGRARDAAGGDMRDGSRGDGAFPLRLPNDTTAQSTAAVSPDQRSRNFRRGLAYHFSNG